VLAATAASGCLVDDSADTPVPAAIGGTAGTGGNASGMGGAAAGASGTSDTGGTGDTGGAAGTGDSGGTGSTGDTGGTGGMPAGAGSAGAAACVPNPTPETCAGFTAPAWGEPVGATPATMVDFATYTADRKWGNADNGELTGGTHLYHGPNDENLTATAGATSLRLTGTITPRGYVGVVFWFDQCVDASAFTGIEFAAGGSLDGAVMKAQIQTHVNYPVDAASAMGGCSFTDCDTKFSECAGPIHQLAVPRSSQPFELPWSAFTGGAPVDGVTPDGLVGLQFQLECQATSECAFNVTLGNVSFAPISN
jgi:hypothetical protein